MRPALTILIVLAGLAAGAAAGADDDCTVPMTDWQPRAAVERMAQARGWTIRRIGIDDGCYEIDGHDAEGRAIAVRLDPGTLAILGAEQDD